MAKAESTDRISSIDAVDVIVDADAHSTESIRILAPYVENEAVRRMLERTADPEGSVLTATRPTPVASSRYGVREDIDSSHHESGTVSGERKLQEMRDFDIDYGIVSPTLLAALETTNNPRVAVELAKAWNSWMVDEFLDDYDSIKAGIQITGKKPDLAAEEIDRRAKEDGFVAVTMAPGGMLPPHGHEMYDPIYQAAEDHGLPILLHGTGLATQASFPNVFQYSETYAEQHVVAHPFQIMWNFCMLLMRGVPERFPDLDFVFQECGIGWAPYATWRLEDTYMEWAEQMPQLTRSPTEIVKDQFYFTTQPVERAPNPEYIAQLIEMIGPDSVMYSADLPHGTFDPPEELFNPISQHFDTDTVNKIMGGTAMEVFDL